MAGPWRASEAAASPPPIRAARRVRPCPPRASLRQVCARTHPRQAGASIRSGGDAWPPASRGGAARRKPRGRPETALEGLRRGGVVSPARGLPAPFQRNSDACSARQGHSTGQAGSCAPRGGIRACRFRAALPTAAARLAVDQETSDVRGPSGLAQRTQGPDWRWVTGQSRDIRGLPHQPAAAANCKPGSNGHKTPGALPRTM
jgi:hypothetical protein